MLRKQPEIQRVKDRAHARDRVIELEVPVVVPCEGGNTVAGFHAHAFQRAGKAVDTRHHLPVGGAVDALVALGHHLSFLVQSLNPPQHVLETELVVLHQAFHGRHLHLRIPQRSVSVGRW